MSGDVIRSQPCPVCNVCGCEGVPLYHGLKDKLYDAPGEWDMRQCANPKCGLLWLDPMPMKEDIGKAYRSYYTHQDDVLEKSPLKKLRARAKRGYLALHYAFEIDQVSRFERILGLLLGLALPLRDYLDFGFAQLADLEKGKMLEVGCGGGELLQSMNKWGWQTEGIDFDPVAVKNARQKGLEVHLGDLGSQRYPDNMFDVVISSHVIEHVPNPNAWVSEGLRILKPGGRMVIVTPNAASWGHSVFKKFWRGLEPPRHLHVFTPSSLTLLMEANSVNDIYIAGSARAAANIFLESRDVMLKGRRTEMGGKFKIVRFVIGGLIHFFEWTLVRFLPLKGNELICSATKR